MRKQKRLVIWAAKGMFKSARKLKDALQPEIDRKVLIVRSMSPRFNPRRSDITINWGNSGVPNWNPMDMGYYKNHASAVFLAVNKLHTFQALEGVCNLPLWTTDSDIARSWTRDEGHLVVVRTKLTGFGGEGIVLTDNEDEIEELNAPLYVQYKKKKKEFRVHVFNGEVIDVTQKKRRKDFEGEVNNKIRNHGNGWVYCREDIVEPADLREQASLAVLTLGLHFGAVDLVWNEKENKSYVLECNTAPGLQGTTLKAYKNAILSHIK